MRLLLRTLAILATFLGVGFWTAHALIAHAVAQGTPEFKVRMAGAMGGLFVGGAAACIVALVLLLGRGRSHQDSSQN